MGSVAMDADYGAPRELSPLQKARALYRPETPPCLQVPCILLLV
jgi:diphosphate-dependent phosphofructokinase